MSAGEIDLYFKAQEWVGDEAAEVEFDDPACHYFTLEIDEVAKTIGVPVEEIDEDTNLSTVEGDNLKFSPNAPEWIQNYDGPFEISIVDIRPAMTLKAGL